MRPSTKELLDKVKEGQRLSKSDRLEALEDLEIAKSSLTTHQLSQALGVTERQVRRDKAELRERRQQALKDMALMGEMYKQFEITLQRIDQAIDNDDHKKVRSLSLRWGVVESFAKYGTAFQIDELAKLADELKAQADLNGNGAHASSN